MVKRPSKEDSIDINNHDKCIRNLLQWQSEYFLEFFEFHKLKARYKIEEACYVENVVSIHENHIPQFNFRVGVIDSFMPARDGIQRIALMYYVTNGKTEIRCIYYTP